MATVPPRSIPTGFPDVLRQFSKEVLRRYPRGASGATPDPEAWVLAFAVDYFRAGGVLPSASAEREMTAESKKAVVALDAGKLEEVAVHLQSLFAAADRDGNGQLDAREFRALITSVGRDIGLDTADVRQLMAAADASQDGLIQYAEFLPVAMDLITVMASRATHTAHVDDRRERAQLAAHHALVHGLTPSELGGRMLDSFRSADSDGDGLISRDELTAALRNNGLGLSKRDINLLVSEADLDASGKLNFEEFAPLCYALLAESVAKQVEMEMVPWEETAIARHLMAEFAQYDSAGIGRLTLLDIHEALANANLHLSWLQMQAIAAEAVVDETGHVEYASFAPVAASFIATLFYTQTDALSAAKLLELRATARIHGMDRPQLQGAVAAALEPLDTAGTGRVYATDARTALQEGLRLDDKQVDAVVTAAKAASGDEGGTIDVGVTAAYAFDVLEQLLELDLITRFTTGVTAAAGAPVGSGGGGEDGMGLSEA